MMDDYIGYDGLTKEEQKMFWIMKSFTDSEADRIVSGPKGSHRAEAINVMNDHATDDRMGRFATEIDVNLFSELANINILVINGRAEGMGERRSNETIRPGLFINYISPRSAELGYQVYPTDTIIITNLGNIHYQLGAIFAGDSLKSALGDSSNEGLTQELRNFIRTFSGRVASGISENATANAKANANANAKANATANAKANAKRQRKRKRQSKRQSKTPPPPPKQTPKVLIMKNPSCCNKPWTPCVRYQSIKVVSHEKSNLYHYPEIIVM